MKEMLHLFTCSGDQIGQFYAMIYQIHKYREYAIFSPAKKKWVVFMSRQVILCEKRFPNRLIMH